jgi:hypothetical protein
MRTKRINRSVEMHEYRWRNDMRDRMRPAGTVAVSRMQHLAAICGVSTRRLTNPDSISSIDGVEMAAILSCDLVATAASR